MGHAQAGEGGPERGGPDPPSRRGPARRLRVSSDPVARRRLAALAAAAGLSFAAGLVVGAGGGEEAEVRPAREQPATRETAATAGLSLERQLGELLVMSFDGTSVPAYIRRRLRDGQGSGVILFAKNLVDAARTRALTRALQRSARGRALVATDQEGGGIRRVPFAGPDAGPARLATPEAAAEAAGSGARDLRRLGIQINLAPVADVPVGYASVMAGRAYPGRPSEVARSVAAVVVAQGREGVASAVKHFPGLGAATANTDDAPVTIGAQLGSLLDRELVPFEAAVRAGVPLVMTSHATYPAVDPTRIASQSPAVHRLLRDRLRFDGAVITDSIEAEAVLARSGVAEAAERSLAAGADLVLMTGSGSWNQVQPRLLRRARRDPRFRARVAAAAERVIALKRRLGLTATR